MRNGWFRSLRAGEINVDDLTHLTRRAAEQNKAVGKKERLVKVVGDQDRRRGALAPRSQKVSLHHFAGLIVEAGERFVQQDDLGAESQRAKQSHPLTHAAAQLAGDAGRAFAEPYLLQQIKRAGAGRLAGRATHFEAEGYVSAGVEPGETDCGPGKSARCRGWDRPRRGRRPKPSRSRALRARRRWRAACSFRSPTVPPPPSASGRARPGSRRR